ncbi:MAG: hypothetical protein N2645_08400 [Clostridia bacterium]|nr:hypothetical protein [Clostridia bacterium]
MIYLFVLVMLASGYYTLTYGLSLWKEDNEKQAGAGVIAIAWLGSLAPIVVMFLKR